MRPGDLLTHIERNVATDLTEVRLILRALRAGDPLLLSVERAGRALTFETTVEAYPLEGYATARLVLDQVDLPTHSLRALWVLPEGSGPFPVVYHLPGAHWASEEHPTEPSHPVVALIERLARAGVASLRVERSGVGDSQGPPCTRVDFETELEGYRAGLQHATGRRWTDPNRVFLFGHSLGAMIAPLLAAEWTVRGVLTYAASRVPISEALIDAATRYARMEGSAAARAQADAVRVLVHEVVVHGRMPSEVLSEREDLRQVAPSHFRDDEAYHRVATFYQQLERQDILRAWQGLRSAALFVAGSRDWISWPADTQRLAELAGPDADYVLLDGVDHHMRDARAGEATRLAASLGETIAAWVVRHGQ